MSNYSTSKENKFLFKALPITITAIGSFLLLYQYFFDWNTPLPILPGIFSEMAKVPLDIFNWGVESYTLKVDNYLIFQNFEVLLPTVQTVKTLCFGIAIWFMVSLGISLISTFKRYYFIAAMALVIFLITLSGINSLNIGGINNNLALIILLSGSIIPAMAIHVFYDHFSLLKRTLIISPIALLTMALLVENSSIPEPLLMMSENISLMALAVTAVFLLYIGHSLVSVFFLILTRLNQGIGIKISWHLTTFTILYLLVLVFALLDLTGSFPLPFEMPPFFPLFLLAGYFGWFETQAKIKQINQPFPIVLVGQAIYWIGFGISALVFWKAEFSANRPMQDFLTHWLVYTQFAFSFLFFAYLMVNFSGFMNSGKSVSEVVFRPRFFAYYHMRIGGAIALLSVILYADGIIGPQLSTSSTNFSADYYYATGRPLEARILFENSWQRYRKNEKAKVVTVLLYINENQLTLAQKSLEEGLEWSPSAHEILLAANFAHKRNQFFDALFYLEKGLEKYPENTFIKNNLALLYSKGNKAPQAFELINEIAPQNKVALANKIGLQGKHLFQIDENLPTPDELVAKTNLMVLKNIKGESADFSLSPSDVTDLTLHHATLRNQWTNSTNRTIEKDIAELDSLLLQANSPHTERQLRTTKVIRYYQEQKIGEALKHLNGLAIDFPTSAGYYHFMASMILTGQGDMEKAAKEFIQAEEKGFQNFKSKYLSVLYFGGQTEAAFNFADKYDLDFPVWMKVQMESKELESQGSLFFRQLSKLNKAVKGDFLDGFNKLPTTDFKTILAHEILIKKGHWLTPTEINVLRDYLKQRKEVNQEYVSQLCQLLSSAHPYSDTSNTAISKLFPHKIPLDANPYRTPFVLMAVEQEKDNEKKYGLLQYATEFNDDPLLWLELVKYSQKIGLGEYGQAALEELSKWVDEKTLEKLKLQTQ